MIQQQEAAKLQATTAVAGPYKTEDEEEVGETPKLKGVEEVHNVKQEVQQQQVPPKSPRKEKKVSEGRKKQVTIILCFFIIIYSLWYYSKFYPPEYFN